MLVWNFYSSPPCPKNLQRDLPRVVNRLLGQVFLYQDKDEDKDDYYFVHRHRSACETALQLAGFNLLHDEYHHISRLFQSSATAAPTTSSMRP